MGGSDQQHAYRAVSDYRGVGGYEVKGTGVRRKDKVPSNQVD